MQAAISFRNVSYSDILNDFSCEIETGQQILIVTAREEESTVLTRLAAGLLLPEQGSIDVFGESTAETSPERQVQSRLKLGIVPFNGGLVSNLKMWENIFLPHFYHKGTPNPESDELADNYLKRLNCSAKHLAFPAHLSVFEKRATAFTRAAIMKPDIMIYCNTLERISKSDQTRLATVMDEFHSEKADRTSVYLSSSAELPVQSDFDAVLYIHPQKETGAAT